MTVVTEYASGTFCWVDLATSDPDGAKAFYAQLFGWSAEDTPAGEQGTYTMFSLNGESACGLYELPAEQASVGIPPHWNSYVSVASADEAAARAKSLGANVMMEPFDVMEVGRMAVIQDPTGAVFCVWEAKAHARAAIVNEPGSLVWNELATRDAEAAKGFYTQLFGWEAKTDPIPGAGIEYTQFVADDWGRGGLMPMTDEWPAEAPPGWLVYFAVDDADAVVEQAKSLGATVEVEPRDIPEVGRFAVITDPQGATFAVIRMSNLPQ